MNRFIPWVGAIVGATIIAIGGYFAYSAYSNSNTNNNEEQTDVESEEQTQKPLALCNGQEDVVFEDQILALVIRLTLGLPEQNNSTIPCDELLRLEELRASDKAIFSLVGLENAVNLKRVDLSKNILLNTDALSQLPNLEAVNLTKTNISEFKSAAESNLTSLDLGENTLRAIPNLSNFSKLRELNLYKNKISDFRPLLEMEKLLSLSIYNNPVDLSPNKENRQIIQQLISKGIDVYWDELSLSLGIGSNHVKSANTFVLDGVNLNARVSLNQTFREDIQIASVEFFEVTSSGVLSSIGISQGPVYSLDVGFDETEEGVYRYAAEVRTKFGATFLTPPSDYVTVTVKKAECGKNADCNDTNQCTTDVCQNRKCVQNPIANCNQCRTDADCKDDRQCTSDRCVSGKCEHYMQTACSENQETSCTDGKDNNKNGKVDCADSDCSGNPFCKETICYDGADNDKDGKIDCRDPDCSIEATCGEICDNGINDDGDSNVDCNDRRDCADHPSCQANANTCNVVPAVECYETGGNGEKYTLCELNLSIGGNASCSTEFLHCANGRCSNVTGGSVDFQGCSGLEQILTSSPPGTRISGAGPLGIPSSQICGSMNLCKKIILCQ